jgi:3-hydroxy-9,10-secoandrosta-1,3,5(10)-triene-9,17-dione monooxygenase
MTTMIDGVPREEFIRRARDMAPRLRDRAVQAEADRRMPDATHREFIEAGFYKLLQPARYGGYQTDMGVVVDVAAELGRGCGSSCWIFSNLVNQAMSTGMKDPRAQDEVWGDTPDALIASAQPGPDANVKFVDGGIEVDGVWKFASGVDFADWVNLNIYRRPENGPSEHRFAQVHKSDFEVIDDWFVVGLAATGSRSVRVRELFIPDYRMMSSFDVLGGPSPGSAVNPATLYRLPFWGIGAKLFAGPAIGIARGALELIEEDLASRVGLSGARLREEQAVQVRLAESGAEIESAWALLIRDCDDAWKMTEAGDSPSMQQRAAWRRNNSYAVMACVRAVDRVHGLAGMRAMLADNHILRIWHEIHAVANQVAVTWDVAASNYGRARFGMPISDPRV